MGECVQERSYSGNGAGRFWAGMLLGGLVGVGAMLLAAPQSGEETRADIWQGGEDLRYRTARKVQEAVSQVRGRARQMAVGAHRKAARLQHDGQEMLDEQKERASIVVKAATEAIQGS